MYASFSHLGQKWTKKLLKSQPLLFVQFHIFSETCSFFFWLNILMFFSFPLLVNLLFLIITCTPGIRVGNKWRNCASHGLMSHFKSAIVWNIQWRKRICCILHLYQQRQSRLKWNAIDVLLGHQHTVTKICTAQDVLHFKKHDAKPFVNFVSLCLQ